LDSILLEEDMFFQNKLKLFTVLLFISGTILIIKPSYYYIKGYCVKYILNNVWNNYKKNNSKLIELLNLKPIGKLIIENINLNCIIIENINDRTLHYGLGKLSDGVKLYHSSKNIVIAGHRDTNFNDLKKIKINDEIILEHIEGTTKYLVKSIKIVDPSNVECLNEYNYNKITLITCYPFQYIGSAPLRYVVQGEVKASI